MNRREALRRGALLLGGMASVPSILGVLGGCSREPAAGETPVPLRFGESEQATVERIVDIMIPRTDTPGALDVGVPAFIATALEEVYSQDVRDRYLEELHAFDAAARREYGKPFLELEPPVQQAFLQRIHDAAIEDENARSARYREQLEREIRGEAPLEQRTKIRPSGGRPFVLATKQLALHGFFVSEPGATQVLQYMAIPGAYHGCLPVSQAGNGKRWATS